MKQKRNYHEISDDDAATTQNKDGNKRMKISQSVMLDQINPEEEEIWLTRIPGHLNPNHFYDKKV